MLEREGPDCLAQLICTGPCFAAVSEHLLSGFGNEKLRKFGQVVEGGVELSAVAEQCFLKFSTIVDLSGVTVFPSLSAVGSWVEMLLFSMDFIVSQNFLELEPQDVFVLVEGSQVWSEPRAKSVLSSTFFERGILI